MLLFDNKAHLLKKKGNEPLNTFFYSLTLYSYNDLFVFFSNLDIFPLISQSDIVDIIELSVILEIIGRHDIKHIMALLIKITSVLMVSTYIITSIVAHSIRLGCDTSDNVCLDLQTADILHKHVVICCYRINSCYRPFNIGLLYLYWF